LLAAFDAIATLDYTPGFERCVAVVGEFLDSPWFPSSATYAIEMSAVLNLRSYSLGAAEFLCIDPMRLAL